MQIQIEDNEQAQALFKFSRLILNLTQDVEQSNLNEFLRIRKKYGGLWYDAGFDPDIVSIKRVGLDYGVGMTPQILLVIDYKMKNDVGSFSSNIRYHNGSYILEDAQSR